MKQGEKLLALFKGVWVKCEYISPDGPGFHKVKIRDQVYTVNCLGRKAGI